MKLRIAYKSMCTVARQVFDITLAEGAEVPARFQRLPSLQSGLWTEALERRRRRADPEFDAGCVAIQRELERRAPGSLYQLQSGDLIYDFAGLDDLRERWEALHQAANARELAARPKLAVFVKPGDWVKIGGHLMRIAEVNEYTGMAFTERVGSDGHVVSGQPAWVVDLQPCAPDDPSADPWPEPPEHLTDALDRARFYGRYHRKCIEDAGKEPPLMLEHEPAEAK